MALTTLGGRLLRVGQQLALSAYCCCTRWCRQTSTDACGNPVYGCSNTQAGSIGECTPECKPPEEPCECGPETPCPECEECIDRQCQPIEDCCGENTPCPECFQCQDNVCVPCGECQQCVNGLCLPCGPCQKCEDGACVECGADEVCIDGVCVPKKYYCCWEDCPNGEDGPVSPPPATACREAIVTSSGYSSPCGTGEDEYGQECDLTKSGPFTSLQQCEPQCERYSCVLDACGNRECEPDPNGPYTSRSECLSGQYDDDGNLTESPCIEDPCATPCTFGGASSPGTYSIDACERDICVSYVSPDSRPIRVQIWGPTLDQDCNIIAARVIKADSDWRGEECCDCDSRPAGDLEGGPKGQIKWTKPRGVTSFEVAVLTACGATANIDIRCSDDCVDPPDPDMCPCGDDDDCNSGCHCCDGECQEEPCEECETDADCFAGAGCFEADGSFTPGGGEEFRQACDARGGMPFVGDPGYCCDGVCGGNPCPCQCPPGCDSGCLVVPNGVDPAAFKASICLDQTPVDVDYPCEPGTDCAGYFCCCNPLP